MRSLLLAAVSSVALVACSHGGAQGNPGGGGAETSQGAHGGQVPGWLSKLPQAPKQVYAVGMSGPTYWAADARQNAADDARTQLAATLRTHVQALFVDVQTSGGTNYSDSASQLSVNKSEVDVAMQNAKIDSTWVDKNGDYQGSQPGTVYALASIEMDSKGGAK